MCSLHDRVACSGGRASGIAPEKMLPSTAVAGPRALPAPDPAFHSTASQSARVDASWLHGLGRSCCVTLWRLSERCRGPQTAGSSSAACPACSDDSSSRQGGAGIPLPPSCLPSMLVCRSWAAGAPRQRDGYLPLSRFTQLCAAQTDAGSCAPHRLTQATAPTMCSCSCVYAHVCVSYGRCTACRTPRRTVGPRSAPAMCTRSACGSCSRR
jgi:hypothetical protein